MPDNATNTAAAATQAAVDQLHTWQKTLISFLSEHGMTMFKVALIVTLGIFAAKWVARFTLAKLARFDLQPPARALMAKVVFLIVLALALLVAAQTAGIQLTPLIAGLSVVGVGVGLATQGVLGNAVAGLTIIFTKPYLVGEYIEVVSVHGVVEDIRLFSTRLRHADRSVVIVPNRKIVGEILHNYGTMRQIVIPVQILPQANVAAVLDLVRQTVLANPRVLREPAPVIGVSGVAEGVVTINVAPFTSVTDFLPARVELCAALHEMLRTHHVPTPQRQVVLASSASLATA